MYATLCTKGKKQKRRKKKRQYIDWAKRTDRKRDIYVCIMEYTDPDTIMHYAHT